MNKKYSIGIILFAVSAMIFLLFSFSLLDIWQERILDTFFTTKKPSSEIVIFAVDNESIAKIGQWPWSRSVFAEALDKLQSAKVVAIDVNFSEASSANPLGDILFSAAIEHSKPNIILPILTNTKTQERIEPLVLFRKGSFLGQAGIISEDGIIRKINNNSDGIKSFGAAAASQYKTGLIVPNAMRIDYYGPEKTFITIPIHDLLDNKVPESIYKNSIVLIGATAPDLHDYFQTPFGMLSGAEINANIINTIVSQRFYQTVPWYLVLVLVVLCNAAAAILIFKIKNVYWLAGALILVFVCITIIARLLFSYHIILPVLYLDLGFTAMAAMLVLFQYITESKEKKFIYESFKYYLSKEVIEEIIASPKKLTLGGEKKKITVFFSDIRGFTSMSELLTPEQLTYVVGEYMTEMTDIIMDHKGLVSQYFGDGIMAFWGAPLPNANQAEDACLSSIAMIGALAKLNERLKAEHIPTQIKIGIGINIDQVIAGNIGSKKKFNYTVFGDGVNLTSRLENLNKVYGTSIIITQATQQEIARNPKCFTRELDTIIVKGKKEPKLIFELRSDPLDPAILERFQKGREYYRAGDFAQAIEEFSIWADQDGPSKTYLERCRDLQSNPPESWNGVYEFKNK